MRTPIGRSQTALESRLDLLEMGGGGDKFAGLSPYLMLNDEGTKINSTLPISTTLNSFYLGEQHKMSSGAENIFFTNLVSGIDWFPMWGGVKDQSIVENQDSSGTISPSGRVYGDFINADFYGPVGNTVIDYSSQIRNLGENLSVFGIEFAPELVPTIGDHYHYRIYSVSDGVQGFVSYEQRIEVTQEHLDRYLIDGLFLFWFNHPSEITAGSDVNIKMFTSKTKILGDGTDLLRVFNNTLVPSAPYIKAKYRVFEDKNLAFEGDIVNGGEGDKGDKGDRGNSFTVTATGSFVESTILSIESSLLYTSENPFVYVVTTDERVDKTLPIDVDDLGLHAVLYDGSNWSDMGQFTGDAGEKGDKGETGATGMDGIQGMQGNSFTVTNSGSLTEEIISTAEFSFIYSKRDPFIYVVTTDDRFNKTVPINNSDLSLHAILYNGDEWADMGEFTGVAGETGEKGDTGFTGEKGDTGFTGETGEKGEKGDTGFTPAEAEAITDTQMKFLGEYKADSGVSLTLSLPDLSMGSVVLETTSGSPEKFYLRYIHGTTDDYVIHVECLHYSGGGEGISAEEGVANVSPTYQTGVGTMAADGHWKRLTPLFSSESYRYARVKFMLLPKYTESSTAGILHAYEILLLTTLSTTDADEVDVIELYGRKT
jgi:hypothetical protein